MPREKTPLTTEQIIEAIKNLFNEDLLRVKLEVEKEVLSRKEKASTDLKVLNGGEKPHN